MYHPSEDPVLGSIPHMGLIYVTTETKRLNGVTCLNTALPLLYVLLFQFVRPTLEEGSTEEDKISRVWQLGHSICNNDPQLFSQPLINA